MSQTVKEISLDAAVPGDVLAEAISDARGAVLLPDGATLSEAILKSLERHGVEMLRVLAVDVAGDEADEEADEDAALRREQVESRLRHLFRRTGDSDAAHELAAQLALYRLEHKS